MNKTQKLTIYDIAKQVGTSAAALNGSWKARRISEKTAHRIQKMAAENGFTVNLQARGLRKARSGLVGMILPEHNNRFFQNLVNVLVTKLGKGRMPSDCWNKERCKGRERCCN